MSNTILITGSSSGVGLGLYDELSKNNNVIGFTRDSLDLSKIDDVLGYNTSHIDYLINCAGTDIDGKINFTGHDTRSIVEILNVNLVAPILLSHSALQNNPHCRIVNITSTNNNHYWGNDLAYSLSKKSLETFGAMLKIDHPNTSILEVRLGLTKTNFNQNRYKNSPNRFVDIYSMFHYLDVSDVVPKIINAMFDPAIKHIEISP
jgi:short-subunit dehydrogenase